MFLGYMYKLQITGSKIQSYNMRARDIGFKYRLERYRLSLRRPGLGMQHTWGSAISHNSKNAASRRHKLVLVMLSSVRLFGSHED